MDNKELNKRQTSWDDRAAMQNGHYRLPSRCLFLTTSSQRPGFTSIEHSCSLTRLIGSFFREGAVLTWLWEALGTLSL